MQTDNVSNDISPSDNIKVRRLSSRSFKMRSNIITEIIKTEESYIQDLKIVKKLFIDPLRTNQEIELVKSIFMNIEVICNLSEQLLKELQRLCPNIENVDPDITIGSAFNQLVAFFNIYSQYCVDYKKSIEICEEMRMKNGVMSLILMTAEQSPLCRGLQLKDFLIKPVQRLCKYPLLFRELLKYTPEDHPDYSGVMSTFQKVEEVSSNVNKIRADRENFEKLTEFNATVAGFQDYDHFVTGRIAIRDEWLPLEELTDLRTIKVPSQLRIKGTSHLHLWSDFLVVTRKLERIFKATKASEFICVFMSIRSLNILDIGDEKKKEFKFVVEGNEPQYNRSRKILVTCTSLGNKMQWVSDIKGVLDKLMRSFQEVGVSSLSASLRTTSSELTRSTRSTLEVSGEIRIDESISENDEPKISIEEALSDLSFLSGILPPPKQTVPVVQKPPRPQEAPPSEADNIVDCVLSILSDLSALDLEDDSENSIQQPLSESLESDTFETKDEPVKLQKTLSRRLSQKFNSSLILSNPKAPSSESKNRVIERKLPITTNPIRSSSEKENTPNNTIKKAKECEKVDKKERASDKPSDKILEKKISHDKRHRLETRMASLPSLTKFMPKSNSLPSSPESNTTISKIETESKSQSPALIRTNRKKSVPDFNTIFGNFGVAQVESSAHWYKSSSLSVDGHIFITATHFCFASSGSRKVCKLDIAGANIKTYLLNHEKKRIKLSAINGTDEMFYLFKKMDGEFIKYFSNWIQKYENAHPQPLSSTSPPTSKNTHIKSHSPKNKEIFTPKTPKRALNRLQRKVTPGSSPDKPRDLSESNSSKRTSLLLRVKTMNKDNNLTPTDVLQAESGSLSISTELEAETENEPNSPSPSSEDETTAESAFPPIPPIPLIDVWGGPLINKTVHDEVEDFLAALEANTSSLYK